MTISERARRFFSRARFVLILCILLSHSACSRHEPPADVTILNGAEVQSLDPAIITGQPDSRVVLGLFEGLTRPDARTARPIPGLAERWEISPDGKIYTFHLRTNIVWSTGEPIRADDVVYSWIRALRPETASDYAGQLYYLKNGREFNEGKIKDASLVGVHAPDPFTIRVELEHPTAFFLDLCAFQTLNVVPRQTIEKYGDHWLKARPLPSSGPFELVYWRLNDKIRLKKNPRYWDAANTQSEILDLLPVGAANAAINLYLHDQADLAWDKELVPAELLDVLLKRPDFHTFNYLGTYFVRFNVAKKPFDDLRVRRALALAVDRERIVKKITRGGETPALHLVPDGTANYLPPDGLDYNPALAKKLLAEAGYPGGTNFPHFAYMFNAAAGGGAKIHENVAVELQQMWRDTLGIQMDLRQMEFSVYLGALDHLDYTLARSSWIGDYNDPQTFLGMFISGDGNNRTGWSNPDYDRLIAAANNEPDLTKRAKLFQQAETLLVQTDPPIIPIFFYVGINYFDTNKISGVYDNILDIHSLQTIRKVNPAK
jgi:oligopeptide transport system substrate-binding protein